VPGTYTLYHIDDSLLITGNHSPRSSSSNGSSSSSNSDLPTPSTSTATSTTAFEHDSPPLTISARLIPDDGHGNGDGARSQSPPPALSYSRLDTINLKKFLPTTFKKLKKLKKNAISPSGNLFLLLTETAFAMLTKTACRCDGELRVDEFTLQSTGAKRKQRKSFVTDVAMTDEYFFIATDTHLFIRETLKGELVRSIDLHEDQIIDKLVVSPNGNYLLALGRKKFARVQLAQVYSVNLERAQLVTSFIPSEKTWNNCDHLHNQASFSADENQIVTYTTAHCQGRSELRFLERSGQNWTSSRGCMPITIHSNNPDEQLLVKGLTRAAMYVLLPPVLISSLHNQHVVWSVDSRRKNPDSWCHIHAKAASRSPFSRAGSSILDMNSSNEFNAIVQLDTHGT
jgi:hypothetical protein